MQSTHLDVAVDRAVAEDLDRVVHEARLEVEEVEDPPERVAVDAQVSVLDTAVPARRYLVHERVELLESLLLLHRVVQVAQADRPLHLQLKKAQAATIDDSEHRLESTRFYRTRRQTPQTPNRPNLLI